MSPQPNHHRWPEGAIVYHIYPRSFQDSNGDGVGDLPGITSRLDYLQSLGVNAIWLSPFYPSPMADFGYDIADYCNVDPLFGTLDDFRTLLRQAHEKQIKVMIDLVPNHTSDAHRWFQESASSRSNPKSDWYVWRDAIGYGVGARPLPPNNWRDVLTGGSAWKWHEGRRQFYLHSFHERQPDLNWTNPAVRDAFREVMRFWLDLGTDGFRVDAVYWLAKEPLFHDDDPAPNAESKLPYEQLLHNNSCGWPAVYAYLTEMCNVLKEEKYRDNEHFMVTEAYPEQHNRLAAYLQFYVGMDPRVAAPFNFEGVSLPWEAKPWRRFLKGFYTALPQLSPLCVASNAFGNHDQPRLTGRIGEASARSAAVMLLTMPGMAFVYYGEELGMTNVTIPPEQVQDPAIMAGKIGRDPERTPMQWTAEPHAGFTTGNQTWLPVAPDYAQRNVAVASQDPESFLSLYQRLGTLRNASPALRWGDLHVIDCGAPEVVGYMRRYGTKTAYVVCINFSDQPIACQLPVKIAACIVSSTNSNHTFNDVPNRINLSPHEAVVCTIAREAKLDARG